MAYIISSGVTSGGIILERDSIQVKSGGMVINTTVNSEGRIDVYKGGTANNIDVNYYGYLGVKSGGTALEVLENGGCVRIDSNATATFTPNVIHDRQLGPQATLHSGTTAYNVAFYELDIFNGGILYNASAARYKWGELNISSGGVANNIVMSGGSVQIFKGGVANRIELNCFVERTGFKNCRLVVSSGGTANGAVVKGAVNRKFNYSGGIIDLLPGGVADYTSVGSGGVLNVSSGATATNTVVGGYAAFIDTADDQIESGTININGGTASHITVNKGGMLNVNGGYALEIVENGGFVSATPGNRVTFASNTISRLELAPPNGLVKISATVHSGTTAVDLKLNSGGSLSLYSSGKLTGKIADFGGRIYASSGAIVDFDLTQVAPGAAALFNNLSCISGTPTYTLTVKAGQSEGVYTLAETAAGFNKTITVVTTVGDELGTLTVGETTDISGVGYALSLTNGTLALKIGDASTPSPYTSDGLIISSGSSAVSSGSIFHDTLLAGGSLLISSGGTADGVMVDIGGTLIVSRGGSATGIVENGGYVEIQNGAKASFVEHTISNAYLGDATLHSGTTATDIKLMGNLFVYEGGFVDGVEVWMYFRSPGDSFSVKVSGGMANRVKIVNPSCTMTVFSGGVANNTELTSTTTITSGGHLVVSSGGTANDTKIFFGSMTVSRGGSAVRTTVDPGGRLQVNSGAAATAIIENGGYVIIDDLNDSGIVFANHSFSELVLSRTSATVHSGTTAYHNTINSGGSLRIYSGGSANRTTVDPYGWVFVSSGGTANSTTVNSSGIMIISSGGSANSTTVNSYGYLYVSSGGTATDIVWTPCEGYVDVKGGYATFVSEYSGVYYGSDNKLLSNAAVMDGMTISAPCEMYVMNGGTANSTTVNSWGRLFVFSGGTANSTTVSSGSMAVYSGGTATGKMTFEIGAVVYVYEGGIFDFDLTQAEAGAAALVNDLSIIQGIPLYTLTVDGTHANGTYNLADGAAEFTETISVVNTVGDELGTLSVGETASIGGVDYTLNRNDGALSVTVGEPVPPLILPDAFFLGDFNGDGYDMLAAQFDSTITVYMNGEPWDLGITLEDGWEVAGVGDFNGDGADDILRVHSSGLVVGEMSDGYGEFDPQVLNFLNEGWDILGVGDFNGDGADDVLIANPTAASETVGLLGYWKGGVEWTLINGYSAEWECVATGDYNGDGKCDMLWRNSFEGDGGLTYNAYCTWIVDDPVDWRMVSVANPAEWNFLCSGDFNGDKMNDIAMINNVGVVGIWGVEDGWLSSWSILSAVTSEWQLAGVADFNADGTDDIAWSNTETGLTGYWQIENKELTAWANIAVVS